MQELYPEIETSSEIKGKALTEGKVTDKSGKPMENVVVTLEVWPKGENLKGIAVGEVVPVSTIAKTLTDKNGKFELKLDDSKILKEYTDDGSANFQIVVHAADGDHPTAFSAEVEKSGKNIVIGESTLEGSVVTEIGKSAPVADLVAEENAFKSKYCAWVSAGSLPGQTVVISQAYSTASNVRTNFTYKKGEEMTMGTATNIGTSLVKFQMSGNTSVKSNATVEYNAKTGIHRTGYYKTAHYYKMQKQCMAIVSHGQPKPTKLNEFRVMPSDLSGGWSSNIGGTFPATKDYNCGIYENSVTIDHGSSVQWSNGVSLKSQIGIDLSSHINFTKNLSYKFTRTGGAKTFRVCGTTGRPEGNTPGVLVARP